MSELTQAALLARIKELDRRYLAYDRAWIKWLNNGTPANRKQMQRLRKRYEQLRDSDYGK